MIQLQAYTLVKDGELAKADALEDAKQEVIQELMNVIFMLDLEPGDLLPPDEPKGEARFENVEVDGIPMLIQMEYHVRTSGVKISAIAQEVGW